MFFDFTDSFEHYLMIQSGSGFFEYSIEEEVVFSGQISFLEDENLNPTSGKSLILGKKSNDFYGSIPKYEIFTIMENSGFNIGDNYKNITNCDIYKNNIQGFVNWNNDWIYFLNSLLKFPLLENYETYIIEAPIYVRRININPKLFEKNPNNGMLKLMVKF